MTRGTWCEARTQGATICRHIGATEDAASRRVAPVRRPGPLFGQAPRAAVPTALLVFVAVAGSRALWLIPTERRRQEVSDRENARLLAEARIREEEMSRLADRIIT